MTDWAKAGWKDHNKGVVPCARVSYLTDAPEELFVARDYTDGVMQCNAVAFREAQLSIETFEHDNPVTPYEPGIVPREPTFLTKNTLTIGNDSKQPPIAVRLKTLGFEIDSATPVHWRVQAGHVFCRTRGGTKTHEKTFREWRGLAYSDQFTLFYDESDDVQYLDPAGNLLKSPPDGPVVGGHVVLTVAVRPPGIDFWLRDVVHIRVIGSNPGAAAYEPIIDRQLAACTVPEACRAPLRNILLAELEQEAGNDLKHFVTSEQKQSRYGGTVYEWPPDPANYPLTTFDFGIGVGQLTTASYVVRDIFWDWGRNTRMAGWIMFHEKIRGRGHGLVMNPSTADRWIMGLWMCESENWASCTPKATDAELKRMREIADGIGDLDIANDKAKDEAAAAQKQYDKAKADYDNGDKTKRDAYEKAKADYKTATDAATAKKVELEKVKADKKSTPEQTAAAQKAYDDAETARKAAEKKYTDARSAYPPAAKLETETLENDAAKAKASAAEKSFNDAQGEWDATIAKYKAEFVKSFPKSWRNLAITGWYYYNGSGPRATSHTRHVEGRPHGKVGVVTHGAMPADMIGDPGKSLLGRLNALKVDESDDGWTDEWEPMRDDSVWQREIVCTPEGNYWNGLMLFEFKPK